MENFFNLRAEKQKHIINAALAVFAKNGYKKASVADIAGEAGIAKGMITYYFGSKKNLYIYLAELSWRTMVEEMERCFDSSITDFFDRLKMISDMKLAIIKRYPAVISFLTSLYFESDKDVAEMARRFIDEGLNVRAKMMFDGMDVSKFKDGVDSELIKRILSWTAEGMAASIPPGKLPDLIGGYVKDYHDYLDLMKRYLYKD